MQGKGAAKFAGKAQPFTNSNRGSEPKQVGPPTKANYTNPKPQILAKGNKYSGNC